MENKNKKMKYRIALLSSSALITVSTLIWIHLPRVNGISWICEQSEECREAAEKEEEANQKTSESLNAAEEYEMKVQELSKQISTQETIISKTKEKVRELRTEIKQTEVKLKEKQEGLAQLLVDMHFDGDAEPIRILAGSSSISDLAEKASRSQVAKQEIAAATEAVQNTKEKLITQKAEVEKLLEQQQTAQEELQAKRGEQQELVNKYLNDAEAYAEVARAAREAQQAAMEAYQAAHPELFGGLGAYYGAFNSYPWQDRCPQEQDLFIDNLYNNAGRLTYAGRYYGCECTSYAAWKVHEHYGVDWVMWGNAGDWIYTAQALGVNISYGVPVANSVGQAGGGPFGHVFWVESINSDGSLNVTEYNNAYATQLYSGDFHYGDFGSRTVSAAEATQYNYLWP